MARGRIIGSVDVQPILIGKFFRWTCACLCLSWLFVAPWACVVGGQKTCGNDSECPPTSRFCVDGTCKVCRQSADCGGGKVCAGGLCLVGGGEISKEKVSSEEEVSSKDGGTEEAQLPEPSLEVGPEKEPVPEEDCSDGSTRPCFGGDPKLAGVGECRSGVQVCRGGSWGRCVGEVGPQTEQCDSKDNDCDGKVDESFPQEGQDCLVSGGSSACRDGRQACVNGKLVCEPNNKLNQDLCDNGLDDDCDGQIDNGPGCAKFTAIPSTFDDYLVMSNGHIVTFSRLSSSSGPELRCYAADGSLVRSTFQLSTERSDGSPVFRALPTGGFVVAWFRYNPFPTQRSGYFRIFKDDCTALTNEQIFLTKMDNRLLDLEVNSKGQFGILYREGVEARLGLFDAAGMAVGAAHLIVSPDATLCSGDFSGRVALNGNGDGAVFCTNSQGALLVRRFSLSAGAGGVPAWKDAAFQALADTSGAQLQGASFLVGMNEKGEMGVEFQSRNRSQLEALLLKADGSKSQLVVLSDVMDRLNNGFAGSHQRVEILQDDFVFREVNDQSDSFTRWFRYDVAGKLVSSASSSLLSSSLRLSGQSLYLRGEQRIYKDAIDLSPGKGLCAGGVACVCSPNQLRRCYTGAGTRTAVSPCLEGLATCSADGSRWGDCQGEVVPHPEVCGDGKDDDCDGKIDNGCTDPQSSPSLGVEDLAIADDGRVVVVAEGTRRIWISCYDTAGKLFVGAYAVSAPFSYVRSARLSIAPKSGRFVVSWLEGVGSGAAALSLRARIFDGQCKPTSDVVTVLSRAHTSVAPRVSIDESGKAAILSRDAQPPYSTRLAMMNATGILQAPVDVDSRNTCGAVVDGLQMAFFDTLGWGVIACMDSSGSLHWRRFSMQGTFLDTSLVPMSTAVGTHRATPSGFRVGVNAQGFAVTWADTTRQNWRVQSYGLDGKPRKNWTLSDRYSGSSPFPTAAALSRFEGDLVFVDGAPSLWRRFYRYDLDGKLIAARARLEGDDATTRYLRSEGKKSVMYIPSQGIRRDILDLSSGAGVCGGSPCFCLPNSTVTCYRFSASPTGVLAPCSAGMKTCAQDGSGYGPCQGEVMPLPESCGNSKDDDCDGKTDEDCPKTDALSIPANVSTNNADMDVNANKEIFWAMVRSLGTDSALVGHCWDGMGASRGATFAVEEIQDKSMSGVQVHASPDGTRWAVSWRLEPPSSTTQKAYVHLFDASCKPVGSPLELSIRAGEGNILLAFGASGQLAVAWRDGAGLLRVSFFDASGTPVGTGLVYEATPSQCGSSSTFRIARNPTDGSGVVTCQGASYTTPYTFRRFHGSGAWVGTAPIVIAATQNRAGSLSTSHLVAMNSTGAFVITWIPYLQRSHQALFFDAAGLVVKSLQYATSTAGSSSNFQFAADRIGLIGDDFVLHTVTRYSPMRWMRYKADGTLVSTSNTVSTSGILPFSSRFVGTNTYLMRSDRIDLKAITFP